MSVRLLIRKKAIYNKVHKITARYVRILYTLITGVIMGETIYVYLVQTDAANRYAALDGADGQPKLGFPYAMVFYMIACLLVFMSVVMMFRIFKQEVNALRQRCNSSQAYEINEAFHT